MYSLELVCQPDEVDLVSAELWEAGPVAIRQVDRDEDVALIAGFETNEHRVEILNRLASYLPKWRAEDSIDWFGVSRDAWKARTIGDKLFLAPAWSEDPTPSGRVRIIHNPGLACGTGEHPGTQLALIAIEKRVKSGCTLIDVGTGSGILAIAALRLGVARAIGLDNDCAALTVARRNFELNQLRGDLVCGSIDCLANFSADITVANINGTVLLAIWDDLLRISRRPGRLVLTGFPGEESGIFRDLLPKANVSELDGWTCLDAAI